MVLAVSTELLGTSSTAAYITTTRSRQSNFFTVTVGTVLCSLVHDRVLHGVQAVSCPAEVYHGL